VNPFRFFSQNLFLKILSLAFAILLWFFVVLEDKVEKEITAEIKVTDIPAGLVLIKEPPAYVYIKVMGPRSILRSIEKKPVVVVLNLKGLGVGKHRIKITPRMLDLPAGLSIQEISPDEIEIVLEKEARRVVKVKPVIYGTPKQGWIVDEIKVSPDKVKIKGPRSLIYRIREIQTRPIDITGLYGEVKKIALLDIPPMIKADHDRVEVTIRFKEKIVTREIKDLPIQIKGLPKGRHATLEPSKINLVLKGPERLLGAFAELKIKAYVELKKLTPAKQLLEIKIELPPGVKVLELEPRKIKVNLE